MLSGDERLDPVELVPEDDYRFRLKGGQFDGEPLVFTEDLASGAIRFETMGYTADKVVADPADETAAAETGAASVSATIQVNPNQWGNSTRYIGGTEGSARFDIDDLTDCGINTLRIYGDMSRFEPTDDGDEYGSPSIEAIKADPNVIPWKRWDEVMDSPYSPHIEAPEGQPALTWRRLFEELKDAGICPVISLRNRDTHLKPDWTAAVPETEADWNEWWEYVFAMGYWLNVRNDYRVDEFEVLNEPDNTPQQGWLGTVAQYCEMVEKTKDALDHLYRTHLPGRTYHVHAPVTSGPAWVPEVLAEAGDHFDSLNLHNYAWWDKGKCVRDMHAELAKSGHPDYPIWLSEWATYDVSYDVPYMALAVVENLIRFSQPGDDHVYGSHIFSFYDWVYEGNAGWGIVKGDGTRHATYYALRLANRALKDAKPTFQATTDGENLMAIATQEPDGKINLLVLNWSETVSYNVSADLSGLVDEGMGEIRQFSAEVRDEVVGQAAVTDGASGFEVPPYSVVLVTYDRDG
jgi:hypothetical protein